MNSSKTYKNKITESSFKLVFILMILSTLLPWFERGDYASYFWGFEVVMEHYLWIPFVYLILFIWVLIDRPKLYYIVLAQVSFLGILGMYTYSVLYLKRYLCNIYGSDVGMDLDYGLASTMISFWLSSFLVIVAFILFQFYLKQRKNCNKKIRR